MIFAIFRLIFLYEKISEEKEYYQWNLDNYKDLKKNAFKLDIMIKDSMEDLEFQLSKKNDYSIKFNPTKNKLNSGINNPYPGSAYLESNEEYLYLLSSTGIFSYSKIDFNSTNFIFTQIKNNLNNFINENQFKKNNWFSFKDLHIDDDKIYVSFTNEYKKDCWNISILVAEINFNELFFKPFFIPDECISSKDNIDQTFNAHQSGGRIISDDNYIYFSTGEFRSRYLAQEIKSIFGKLLRINKANKNFDIISLGHRNAQGLVLLDGLIFSTEHGPRGGDELNLIDIYEDSTQQNFGWPISSYGKHYLRNRDDIYEKYPLHDSHSEYGFVEPLKYFVPSIGISEIIYIDNYEFVFSSLVDRSLYYFVFDKPNKNIRDLKRIFVGERIRDLIKIDHRYGMAYLENSASLLLIDFSNFKSIIK